VTSDRIINLRSEDGDKGGEIVATSTREQMFKVARSYTARYLKLVLGGEAERVAAE
jgi:excinuclease UvrABC ATPase subunit